MGFLFESMFGPLSVVAHNRKVVGALSVVGATESQIFTNFLDYFPTYQQISKLIDPRGNELL